jgi:hypothetical protein
MSLKPKAEVKGKPQDLIHTLLQKIETMEKTLVEVREESYHYIKVNEKLV